MGDIKPDPDPTILTTEALTREVAYLKEMMNDKLTAERELVTEKFNSVWNRLQTIENHRIEQKADTKSEITKAFDANTEAIKSVEKIQSLQNDRIIAVESERKGGVDMRAAILGFIGIALTVITTIAAMGIFR
jgi:hypothetical protein